MHIVLFLWHPCTNIHWLDERVSWVSDALREELPKGVRISVVKSFAEDECGANDDLEAWFRKQPSGEGLYSLGVLLDDPIATDSDPFPSGGWLEFVNGDPSVRGADFGSQEPLQRAARGLLDGIISR